MPYDTHSIFAASTVVAITSITGSTMNISVASGDGARFSINQQVTICPQNIQPILLNSMIARITAIAGDSLTIDYSSGNREGSLVRQVQVGDQISNSFTPKLLTDIENTLTSHSTNTSNPHSVTASQVGLGSVTNDAQLKLSDKDTDGTLTANSDVKIPSQKAVKTYVDTGLATKQASLGFTPVNKAGDTMTGALTAPIKDKAGQVYNVKAYGAVGNGTTDDTAAIQSAINAASSAGGGTVFLPPATYIAHPDVGIIMASNVKLIGVGNSSIIKIPDSYNINGDLLQVTNCNGSEVRDILLEGNKSHQSGGGVTPYGLFLSTSTNCLIRGVTAQNFTGDGIQVYNSDNCQVTECYGLSNGYHGIETERCRGCIIKGNFFLSNTLHGIFISPGEVGGTGSIGNTYVGNVCELNGQYGIGGGISNIGSDHLSTNNIIVGNIVRSNSQYGIQMYKCDGFTIMGNDIAYNGYFGIYIFQGAYHQIIGNNLHNNSQASNGGYDEIMLEGYSSDNTHPAKGNLIANNTIRIDAANKARYAINEGSANDGANTIVNNIIPSAGTAGTINSLCATDTLTSPAGSFQVYGGTINAISGANAGIDNAFNILRVFSNLSNSDIQIVSSTGTTHFYNNGTEYLTIDPNGNVTIRNSSLATNATNGFLYIPSMAGTPTGVPSTKTGLVPMVYDTTNHKFWIYDTAWKGVVLA
jgi:parallel beta-helix repeat protein